MTYRPLMWLGATLLATAPTLPAHADELDDVTRLGNATLRLMTDFLTPPANGDPNTRQNLDLVRDCLGYSATSGVRECRDAEVAGTGLVCPAVSATPRLDQGCSAQAWSQSSRSLAALTRTVLSWDSSFKVDIKLADSRTSLQSHTHTFTGAHQVCDSEYVTQHDVFRLTVAIYQGTQGTVTLPADPRLSLQGAEGAARDASGGLISGPVKAVCLKQSHPTPRSCNMEDAEREGRTTPPPHEDTRDVHGGATEQ